MKQVLAALKDIQGVEGSFVLNERGALAVKEMPPIFSDDIFPEIGRRLMSIYQTLDSQVTPFDDILLKFEGYWLYCRRAGHGFLNILTVETVNYPALKMASNLALNQINEQLPTYMATAAAAAAPAPAPAPVPAAPAAPAAPAPYTPPTKRYFRGVEVT